MIRTAAEIIGPEREVVLLADRGSCDLALFQLLSELGWHWRVRIKNSFLVYKPDKGWHQVRRFTPAPGQAIFWHHVYVSRAPLWAGTLGRETASAQAGILVCTE